MDSPSEQVKNPTAVIDAVKTLEESQQMKQKYLGITDHSEASGQSTPDETEKKEEQTDEGGGRPTTGIQPMPMLSITEEEECQRTSSSDPVRKLRSLVFFFQSFALTMYSASNNYNVLTVGYSYFHIASLKKFKRPCLLECIENLCKT